MFDNWPDGYFYSWLAGFWEGEGSFIVEHKGNKTTKMFLIYNTNINILEEIKKKLGFGIVYVGKVRNVNHKPEGVYRICKLSDIWKMASFLLPYLTFRKEFFKRQLALIASKSYYKEVKRWTIEETNLLSNNIHLKQKKLVQLFPDINYNSVKGNNKQYKLNYYPRPNSVLCENI